jgi:hypothetical protein
LLLRPKHNPRVIDENRVFNKQIPEREP